MCLRAKGSTHHTAASEAALGRVAAEQALNALLGGHVATELGYVAEDLRDLRLLTMEVHAESKSHLLARKSCVENRQSLCTGGQEQRVLRGPTISSGNMKSLSVAPKNAGCAFAMLMDGFNARG
jgi:hypothetical protein